MTPRESALQTLLEYTRLLKTPRAPYAEHLADAIERAITEALAESEREIARLQQMLRFYGQLQDFPAWPGPEPVRQDIGSTAMTALSPTGESGKSTSKDG